MTQAELAKQINCSQSNISKYENGELRIEATLLLSISKVLKCSISDLYEDTGQTQRTA